MSNGIQALPPKMAAQFAERAKRGEADVQFGRCYDFFQGNTRVSLVSLDPPMGHIQKLTAAQMQRERAAALRKSEQE